MTLWQIIIHVPGLIDTHPRVMGYQKGQVYDEQIGTCRRISELVGAGSPHSIVYLRRPAPTTAGRSALATRILRVYANKSVYKIYVTIVSYYCLWLLFAGSQCVTNFWHSPAQAETCVANMWIKTITKREYVLRLN